MQMIIPCHLKHVVGVLVVSVMFAGCCKRLKKDIPLVELGSKDRSSDFADVFCSLIATEKRPDGTSWGICSNWLDKAPTRALSLTRDIDSRYRFLLIAGFGSDCLKGPHATFMDSIEHLQYAHSFTAETLPVSAFGSSEFNAKQIAVYLNSHSVLDQRKYIVLGYSKGMADLQVALADEPGVLEKVAAFVTLSGVVQGSRLTSFPKMDRQAVSAGTLQDCTPGDMGAVKSMKPEVRKAFLAKHPHPLVPTYSVAAYSSRENTSNVLRPTWDLIAAFGQIEDSQMIAAEAVYPGGAYLGLLKADHWAIAIPFERTDAINKNDFPRAQLFETVLRFVIADLSGTPPAGDHGR
jgi:hypothetical protein